MKIFGREITITKGKEEKPKVNLDESAIRSFSEYVNSIKEQTGKSEKEIIDETFSNGFFTVNIEETGQIYLDASQMFQDKTNTKDDKGVPISEYIRLRKEFAPVSRCIDYIKEQLIGGGISLYVENPKNKHQMDTLERANNLIRNINQDILTRNLDSLLDIILDNALTTGLGCAEILYETPISFSDYAISNIERVDGKEVVNYDINQPDWKELKGVEKLHILENAHERIEPIRNAKSWEIEYFNYKGSNVKNSMFSKNQNNNSIKLHTWQVFWLSPKRIGWDSKGESIIAPIYSTAIYLEKISKAVSEGIHRAGNKKYIMICGTAKAPWGTPYIRNALKQFEEASRKNWATIPVPAGFDIKEMGGEVFDGNDVMNYFKETISKSLGVPPQELGIDSKVELKTNFSMMRNRISDAIQYQILEPHLYASFGSKRVKQGGSSENIYIPKVRFKLEDLYELEEYIEKIFKPLLNIANPIDPVLKHKNQIIFCEKMGWYDTIKEMQSLEEKRKEVDEENEIKKELAELDLEVKKLELKNKKEAAKQFKERSETNSQPNDFNDKESLNENVNNNQKTNVLSFEKKQGDPKAQTVEQQEKRLQGGVNVRKSDSKKGKIES